MEAPFVFLVTRDLSLVQPVKQLLKSIDGLQLKLVSELEEVCPWIRQQRAAIMLCHVRDEREAKTLANLMRDLAVIRKPVVTLAISDRYNAEQALDLLRAGAADYLSRPLDLGRFAYLVDVLTARVRIALTSAPVSAGAAVPVLEESAIPLPYSSIASLAGLVEQVQRAAVQDVNILLGGETGSGKTWLARLIHDASPRKGEPFLTVNGGSLSATLIESEMFGHVRGAFTGADRDRAGKFTAAGRGTLLLDDIDALPLDLQSKLLRVLDEHVFEPVGSNRSSPLQARVIAASNRNLKDEVAAGRFRADLYYRLNVVTFSLPPLREYRAHLPELVARFLDELAVNTGRPAKGVNPDALRALQDYHWPGNLRELHNALKCALILCKGECIGREDLPATIGAGTLSLPRQSTAPLRCADTTPASALTEARNDTEARLIAETLARHGNNRLRAAAALGISRMTLYNKMHRYGLIAAELPELPQQKACGANPDDIAPTPHVCLGEAVT